MNTIATKPANDKRASGEVIVSQTSNRFASDLFRCLNEKNKGNLFFSPFSIHAALAMTAAGASGETLEAMLNTLHISGQGQEIHKSYQALLRDLQTPPAPRPYQSGDNYRLNIANAIYGNVGFPVEQKFIELVTKFYDAAFNQVDFSAAQVSAKQINDWVEEKTNNRIKNLVPADALNKKTSLVLVNCIWFKGSWDEDNSFVEANTKPAVFYGTSKTASKGEQQVQMMHRLAKNVGYYEDVNLQAIRMNYVGGASMTIVLPKDGNGPVFDADYATKIASNMTIEDVNISLPKFKVEQSFSLAGILKQLGMGIAFSDDADFSGISTDEPTKISDVIHKAFIEVDEKGTEAAAATAVMMMRCVGMMEQKQPKTFNANHPFVYWISNKSGNEVGAPLFVGRVSEF